jgi:hypothetical protein
LLAAGCRETAPSDTLKKAEPATQQSIPASTPAVKKVAPVRQQVKTEPVAEYKEKTDNPLNDWYFSVKLYETPKTFQYLVKLKYEELEGDDTLTLPDFGTEPKPVIQKGNDKYSCIIGFMDNHNQFREYKKVYVKNNELKITALKHYTVASY